MKTTFFVLASMLTLSTDAFAWSSLAHKAVAEAVQTHLDKTTAEAIAKLYSLTELPAGALAKGSMWPDQIRALKRYGVKASGPAIISGISSTYRCSLPGIPMS